METIERGVAGEDMKSTEDTILDRESFVELMESAPESKLRRDKQMSENITSPEKSLIDSEHGAAAVTHENASHSDIESSVAAMKNLDDKNVGRRSKPANLRHATPSTSRKRKSADSCDTKSERSKSQRRSLPADIVNMFTGKSQAYENDEQTTNEKPNSRKRGKKTPEENDETNNRKVVYRLFTALVCFSCYLVLGLNQMM